MTAAVAFTRRVGVAPGTTTLQLGLGGVRVRDPYTDLIALSDATPPTIFRDRPIRWDLVGVVGGGSLLLALSAAFIAAALRR